MHRTQQSALEDATSLTYHTSTLQHRMEVVQQTHSDISNRLQSLLRSSNTSRRWINTAYNNKNSLPQFFEAWIHLQILFMTELAMTILIECFNVDTSTSDAHLTLMTSCKLGYYYFNSKVKLTLCVWAVIGGTQERARTEGQWAKCSKQAGNSLILKVTAHSSSPQQ